MNDTIHVTHWNRLEDSDYGRDYVTQTMTNPINGKHCPTGLAGYIVGECTVVCHECIGEESTDYDDPYPIFADSETDYPGHSCEDCDRSLDTYLLVNRSQDPELFWRLEQAESLGLDGVPSIEAIANSAKREAYELGWETCGPYGHGEFAEGGEFADQNPRPTEHGGYDTGILPQLRALAGFADRGHGTYQECYFRVAQDVLSEDILEGYQAGYIDCAEGRERGNLLDETVPESAE